MPRSQKIFKKKKNVFNPNVKPITVSCDDSLYTSPTGSPRSQSSSSSSKKKISGVRYFDNIESEISFDLVNVSAFAEVIKKLAVCRQCGGELEFTISHRIGLKMKTTLQCAKCLLTDEYINASLIKTDLCEKNLYDINLRYVFGLRTVGLGKEGGTMLSAVMNLPPPPIFQDLAKPELLKKCVHGQTQNLNESFNNVVWAIVPKRVFVTLRTLKMGVYSAVSTFNMGQAAKCKILELLHIDPGFYCLKLLNSLDEKRIRASEYKLNSGTKEARIFRSKAKKKLEDDFEEEEGKLYEAGGH